MAPSFLDRFLMHNPENYILFGFIAVALIVAWALYIWKLGGFVRYFGNPWPSLVIIAIGAVAGLAVWGMALKMQKYPTLKEIQETPSWEETKKSYSSKDAPEDKRSYEDSVGVIKDDENIGKELPKESKTPTGYDPLNVKRVGNREVIMDASKVWRERLQVERDLALQKAKNGGIAAGLLVVVLGYLFAAMRLPAPARQEDYDMMQQDMVPPAASNPASPLESPAPPADQPPPPPLPAEIPAAPTAPASAAPGDDVVVSDSGDAPISIDELEKGYNEYQKRQDELK